MKFVIVNSVKDGKRYLRKQNKKNQTVTHDVECVHLVDLAKDVIVKKRAKLGNLRALDVLDSASSADVLLEILEENVTDSYFVPKESLSLDTVQEILRSLNQLRMGEVTNAYEEAEDDILWQKKELVQAYENVMVERDLYDLSCIYHEAIGLLETEGTADYVKSGEYVITDVCKSKLTAVERAFLELYTEGKYSEFSLKEAFGTDLSEWGKGATFFKSYGIANEVNYVVGEILKHKQKVNEVEIFYASSDYEPYIEAAFGARGIPYAMINRQLPTDNLYLSAMKQLVKWAAGDYVYEELRPVMLMSKKYRNTYFSQIRAGIGWSKVRYEQYLHSLMQQEEETEENRKKRQDRQRDFGNCLMELVQIFEWEESKAPSYRTICERLVDGTKRVLGTKEEYRYVSGVIGGLYERVKHLHIPKNRQEVIDVLTRELSELTYADAEIPQAVCIRKLDAEVHVLERKHVYVMGMSNTHYSSSSAESPVLSDEELATYLDTKAGYVRLHKNEEEEKRRAFFQTLSTRDLEGTLCLGYCYYDTVNQRELSPALPFIRMMQETGVKEDAMAYTGYENVIVSNIIYMEENVWPVVEACEKTEVCDEAAGCEELEVESEPMESELVESEPVESEPVETESVESEDGQEEQEDCSPIENWSTTSLQQLLSCPLQFYYQRVMHLPNEDYKVPMSDRWLPASEKGTLAHGIMEGYCKAVFLGKTAVDIPPMVQDAVFEEVFDNWVEQILANCPYVSKAAYEMECELVKKNCRAYLEKMHKEFSASDNPWVVIACEKDFKDIDLEFTRDEETITLTFTGQMDRIDSYTDEDGVRHYRIMDYKSGSKEKNQKHVDTFQNVQHIVYKLALEKLESLESDASEDTAEKIQVDEVRYLHFFEDNVQDQEILCSGEKIIDFPEAVHEFVVEVLKEKKYRKYSIFEDKKDEPCKYCTYKDICKENIGDEL